MRHDDDRPFEQEEGPRGFADIDGGYPVETDLDEPHPADSTPPPASPLSGRRLHNPLPTPSPAPEEDEDWYGPEPARASWRVIVPIAVLIISCGVGVWLAIPSSNPTAAPPPSTSTTPQALPQQDATHRATPRRTPFRRPTPTPSRTTPSHPTTSPSRTSSMLRPTRHATVTITTKVTVTSKAPHPLSHHGPEEPPSNGPHTLTTCLTWSDCHDGPPKG
ncbi:hypothetical protein [Nonomuraea fuscirosea]|uniref:hypothetical protein n=1 Tax=Nonomuraea fuscirosea TaxID=1291556 RepID=UPI0033CB9875